MMTKILYYIITLHQCPQRPALSLRTPGWNRYMKGHDSDTLHVCSYASDSDQSVAGRPEEWIGGVSYPNECSSSLLFPRSPWLAIESALSAAVDWVNKFIMTSYALSLGSMNKLSFFNFGALNPLAEWKTNYHFFLLKYEGGRVQTDSEYKLTTLLTQNNRIWNNKGITCIAQARMRSKFQHFWPPSLLVWLTMPKTRR